MNIEEVLAGLKKDYINAFPFKLEEISKRIHSKDKEAVISLFHQIKGSGKTYGFVDISTCAEQAENDLQKANDWVKSALYHHKCLNKVYEDLIQKAA
tara:strand:+ start:1071 stop:1361 length:291 start_codon:yes stop_codon:yes gene_type:complete